MLPLNDHLAFPFPARVISLDFQAASVTESGLAIINLTLHPLSEPQWIIQLSFVGVVALSVPKVAPEGIHCAIFEVSPTQTALWENIRWMVGDFKTDALTFYAQTAEVRAITSI